jgi:hypothetical protein
MVYGVKQNIVGKIMYYEETNNVKTNSGYCIFVSDVRAKGAADGCGWRRRAAERRS